MFTDYVEKDIYPLRYFDEYDYAEYYYADKFFGNSPMIYEQKGITIVISGIYDIGECVVSVISDEYICYHEFESAQEAIDNAMCVINDINIYNGNYICTRNCLEQYGYEF